MDSEHREILGRYVALTSLHNAIKQDDEVGQYASLAVKQLAESRLRFEAESHLYETATKSELPFLVLFLCTKIRTLLNRERINSINWQEIEATLAAARCLWDREDEVPRSLNAEFRFCVQELATIDQLVSEQSNARTAVMSAMGVQDTCSELSAAAAQLYEKLLKHEGK